MERFDIDLISTLDQRKLYARVRQALVCGFFMQVAHRSGKNYLTVKDDQVCLFFLAISSVSDVNYTGRVAASVMHIEFSA